LDFSNERFQGVFWENRIVPFQDNLTFRFRIVGIEVQSAIPIPQLFWKELALQI